MRALGLVLALGACDAAFGLQPTHLPPPDAPPACPPIGTPPLFAEVFHQVTAGTCSGYATSSALGNALAFCSFEGTPSLASAALDAPLVRITVAGAPSCARFDGPRLWPEGDHAFVHESGCGSDQLLELSRVDDLTWQIAGPLAITWTPATVLSVPSEGPNRHVLVIDNVATTTRELVAQGDGTWLPISSAPTQQVLGNTMVGSAQLSPDGRRVVASVGAGSTLRGGVLYGDRASLDASFTPAGVLAGVPAVDDAFLSEDCGKLYFSGAQRVFYERQQ